MSKLNLKNGNKYLPLLLNGSIYLWIFTRLLKPITDSDVWWHLASGRAILTQLSIPTEDIFSLTASGTTWINTYWLFDVLLYAAYSVFHTPGVIVLHALCVILAILIQHKILKDRKIPSPLIALTIGLIMIGSGPRPFIWEKYANISTIILISFLFLVFEEWRKSKKEKYLWWTPVLFLIWANLHRGFSFGLVIFACYCLAHFQQPLKLQKNRIQCFLVSVLATLLTPFHVKTYKMMWDDFTLSSQYIYGWDTTPLENLEIYWMVLFIFWMVLIYTTIKTRKGLWYELLVSLFLTTVSVRHNFAVPFFMIFACPTLITFIYKQNLFKISKKAEKVWIYCLVPIFLLFSFNEKIEGGLNDRLVPKKAFDIIDEYKLQGPFYNDYGFGGYWIYRFNGTPPVFIDGRYPAVEGYKLLILEINDAKYSNPDNWQSFLNQYNIQGALVKYHQKSPFPSLYQVYFPRNEWALVYWDDAGLLFLNRNNKENKNVINVIEFKEIHPDMSIPDFLNYLKTRTKEQKKRLEWELLANTKIHARSFRLKQFIHAYYGAQK